MGGWRARARSPFAVALALVGLLALGLRMVVVWKARRIGVPADRWGDSGNYMAIGYDWAHRKAQTNFYWPPGYPLFLALVVGVREVTGSIGSVRLWIGTAQAVLATVEVVVVGVVVRRLTDRLGAPRVAGILAALVLAVWPGQVIGVAQVMSEGSFTPLLVVTVALLFWDDRPSLARLRIAGVLLAALWMTRASALPAVAVIILVASVPVVGSPAGRLWHRIDLARCRALAAAFGLAALPWYSHLVLSDVTLFPPDTSGFNLCVGNHDGATGRADAAATDACDPSRPGESALDTQKRQQAQAVRWMLGHPGREAGLVVARFAATMQPADHYEMDYYPEPGEYRLPISEHRTMQVDGPWWILMSRLAVLGLVAGVAALGWRFARVALCGAAMLIGPLLTTGNARYHDPLVPFLVICLGVLASVVMWAAGRAWRRFG